MKRTYLARLETAVQNFIEGSLGRLLGGRLDAREIQTKLLHALEESHKQGETANQYTVYVHPQDRVELLKESLELPQQLARHLVQWARRTRITLANHPEVALVADEQLKRQEFYIQAEVRLMDTEVTGVYDPVPPVTAEAMMRLIRQADAFLIIDGRQHVSLHQPLITLGRQKENDIVLPSPAVSRRHAQIRWRYGRFILYDVSGRGSTSVNDDPVTEWVLHAGDVIQLSDTTLIYGEGAITGQRHPIRSVTNRDDPSDQTQGYFHQGETAEE